MRRRVTKRALENLLLQAQELRNRLTAFKESTQDLMGPLDRSLPDAEIREMASARANLLGLLECLLADDLEPAIRKLTELDGLLGSVPLPSDLRSAEL